MSVWLCCCERGARACWSRPRARSSPESRSSAHDCGALLTTKISGAGQIGRGDCAAARVDPASRATLDLLGPTECVYPSTRHTPPPVGRRAARVARPTPLHWRSTQYDQKVLRDAAGSGREIGPGKRSLAWLGSCNTPITSQCPLGGSEDRVSVRIVGPVRALQAVFCCCCGL